MARIPSTKRFIVEEFKEQRPWIEKLLGPLNDFILNVNNAFNNNLTFTENLSSQISVVKFQTDSSGNIFGDYSFKNNLKGNAVGVWIVRIQDTAANPVAVTSGVFVDWSNGDGQIIINNVTGLGVSKEYNITFIAITG